MNPVASASLVAVALGFGLWAGVLIGRSISRRPATRPDVRRGPTLAELLQRTFRTTGSGLAVLSGSGEVVLHNRRAAELGVVRAGRPDPRAWAACRRVLDGVVATDVVDLAPLEARGRQPAAVMATVQGLGDGFTLVEAADMSESVRLEATRRDFVANVSHELKTPVGAVGLLAEAVLDSKDDPETVERFASKILRESTRLGHLVTELIALSRLTGAEALPDLEEVEVDEVVSEALGRSRLSAESARIDVTVDEPSGITVDGDRTLLVTALSNLLENAIAYSPPDASVSVSRTVEDGWVEVSVTDRGIGIAPEHQVRVFERFFRVDPARSRATGGTGLGLAIVKHVLANHGGEVRLWSRPGTGSTFTMRLPAARPVAGDRDPAGASGVGGV
ncbi:two-component system, OmpR family, sensor histidine kinase SenX3 [Pseudonocardia oroxyli]|uniref:Sensor-like histidine kinase SenX3 n=1 Tax=Pseudonocardia oroxyli TaxID=366584 RepID=A0A1G7FXT4_PSEOR|nr:two-component system, OmpR family, sensor histidine kinase SenX3 [Pseudonocardia oroxyli]